MPTELDPIALQAGFGLAVYAMLPLLFKALSNKGIISRDELEGIMQQSLKTLQDQQSVGAPEDLYKAARLYLESLSLASEVTRDHGQSQGAKDGEQA